MSAIIVHGGAWDIPKELWDDHLRGCSRAIDLAHDLLKHGISALDVVEATVSNLEEDCVFDAGCGSFLNEVGEVEMDAMIMDGRDLSFGSVAALHNIKHPIKVARKVMQETPHCMLVGEGALRFARSQGFDLVPSLELINPRERERWERIQSMAGYEASSAFIANGPKGTVGAVAQDDMGNIATATSTGGTPNKMVGRVGDSPLIGCGTYADNLSAGVSATGFGESLMKICVARRVCEQVERGAKGKEAGEAAIRYLVSRVAGKGGLIVLDRHGEVSFSYNTPHMAVGYIDKSDNKKLHI